LLGLRCRAQQLAQVPTVENQRTPTFAEEVTKLVAKADGPRRIAFTLLAASGLRAGELFGLEVKHFVGNTLMVEQSFGKAASRHRRLRTLDAKSTCIHPWQLSFGGSSVIARTGSSFGARKEHPFINRIFFVAIHIHSWNNSESKSRVFTASVAFVLRTLNLLPYRLP